MGVALKKEKERKDERKWIGKKMKERYSSPAHPPPAPKISAEERVCGINRQRSLLEGRGVQMLTHWEALVYSPAPKGARLIITNSNARKRATGERIHIPQRRQRVKIGEGRKNGFLRVAHVYFLAILITRCDAQCKGPCSAAISGDSELKITYFSTNSGKPNILMLFLGI